MSRPLRRDFLGLDTLAAVDRAKEACRNRVERVNAIVGRSAPPREGMSID
jgi:hypothetical protein